MKPQVYLLCGLTGSGKTTYAQKLVQSGATRLSLDEAVFERYGSYGIDYPQSRFFEYETIVKKQLEEHFVELIMSNKSVVLDYGFWKKEFRDYYKSLCNEHNAKWRLLYFKVSKNKLLERLNKRNKRTDANAIPVTESDLDDFYERFEEPRSEGQETIFS